MKKKVTLLLTTFIVFLMMFAFTPTRAKAADNYSLSKAIPVSMDTLIEDQYIPTAESSRMYYKFTQTTDGYFILTFGVDETEEINDGFIVYIYDDTKYNGAVTCLFGVKSTESFPRLSLGKGSSFYVEVGPRNSKSAAPGNCHFTLRADQYKENNWETEPNDQRDTPNTLSNGQAMYGTIQTGGDEDYYIYEAKGDGSFDVEFTAVETKNINLGWYVYICDSSFKRLVKAEEVLASGATYKNIKTKKGDLFYIMIDAVDEFDDDCPIDNAYSLKVTETITSIPVSGVTISGEKVVRVGKSINLGATVSPSNAANKALNWSSSNESIASVSSSGKVTAKKSGNVTIKATSTDGSGKSGTYNIKVITKTGNPPASTIAKKTSAVKAKAQGSKKVKVSWKKQNTAIRYEIQLSKNKKFSKNLISKTAAKNKSSLSVKYTKTGTVYIRVRAVDKYGYVGKWSDIKTVKIK